MNYFEKRFENKVAIITGAAQGIGEAIARRYVAEGGKAVLADMQAEKVQAVADSLGSATIAVECDVRSRPAVDAMVEKAIREFGQIDILINNAGVLKYAPFLEITEEMYDYLIDINIKGTFHVAQAVAAKMANQESKGVIVNLASVNSEILAYRSSAYASTKGAVKQLTKGMAVDLGRLGIRVNALAPGFTATPMTELARHDEEKMKNYMNMFTIKRPAEPEEQAAVALFLASSDSSYMTGEMVIVDGGWTLV